MGSFWFQHVKFFFLSYCDLFPPANMCDNLNNITNGRVELSGNFVGAIATYFCVTGYNLVGNKQRVCQGNGQWDGVEPSCKSKLLSFY